MSHNASRVMSELSRYLAGDISLGRFVELFLACSWMTPAREGHATRDLLREIELRLAEHSNGHLTEDELRQHLSRLRERSSVISPSSPRKDPR